MANPSELSVISSNAIKEAYLELVPQFERASGHKVTTTWAGTQGILERLKRGETYDLLIMAANWVDELSRQGTIVAGSRADLVRSGIGVAVRAGAPKPDIGSAEALKRALIAAKSVAYSTGPSGIYLQGLFERLGVADNVNAKLKVAESGKPVGDIVVARRSRDRLPAGQRVPAGDGHRLCRAAAGRRAARVGVRGRPARRGQGARCGEGAGRLHQGARRPCR